jgi:hypothetical protein
MGFKHYGVNTGGLPIEYLKRFTERYAIPIFIETGTAGGDSVRAAAPLFKECHTIEIVGGRPSGTFPENVTLHEGNSALLLGNIAKQFPNDNIFFWLDAHWSEPRESAPEESECPIMEEIEAIRNVGQRALIMIDDARLFYGRTPWPCNPSKWPRFQFVFEKLRACFPEHITTIVDDYIICFPISMDGAHRDEWYENYTKRFPSDEMKLKQSVKDSYQALLKYME